MNFTEVGTGVRASVTLYDRGHTAQAHMKSGEVHWKRIFVDRGVRWFHTGGILTALSDSCADVALESMKAAHEAGTIVSYDLNFRSKLWSSKKAIDVTRNLVPRGGEKFHPPFILPNILLNFDAFDFQEGSCSHC